MPDLGLLNRLQLGGERGYGWGRVQAAQLTELRPDNRVLEAWRAEVQAGRVTMLPSSSERTLYLPAHVPEATDDQRAWFAAPLAEPWLGRRITRGKGEYGLRAAVAAWAPGSRLWNSRDLRFEVGKRGQWVKQRAT